MEKNELWAIKEKANENALAILESLDIDFVERYHYVSAPCPIHGGGNPNGWSFHLQMGVYQCYTRGCHETHGKFLLDLIKAVKSFSFLEAVEYARNFCNLTTEDIKDISERRKNSQFVTELKKNHRKKTIYPDDCLENLTYHDYLETRGFTRNLIERYEIGVGRPGRKMQGRIIFPIRNIDGDIVGFTGRDIVGRGSKWLHSFDFDKANNLFNIGRARSYINETSEAIIVEGPIDVLRLEQSGIHNGVAIFGRSLSNGQISILMKAGANKLIIALDGDKAGITGAMKAKEAAKAFFDVEIKRMKDGEDIGSLSTEEVREMFCEKIWN